MSDTGIYTPEFIPYYWQDVKRMGLTFKEGLVYGFIRFYLTTSSTKFYFSNDQLSDIILCSRASITNAISKLEKLGVISVDLEMKAGGGTMRFIRLLKFSSLPGERNSRLLDFSSPTTKIKHPEIPEEVQGQENEEIVQANKEKENKEKNIKKENPEMGMSDGLSTLLLKKEKNSFIKSFRDKYHRRPTDSEIEKHLSKASVTLTQAAAAAISPYPNLESITEEVLKSVAVETKTWFEDTQLAFQTLSSRIRGGETKQQANVREQLVVWILRGLSKGWIEKKKTQEELLQEQYGDPVYG